MPEDSFDFGEVGFGEVGARVYRAVVYTADLQGERVGLRGDQQVCSQAAEFVRKAVAYVQRNAQRGGRHGHSQRQSRASQKLVARAAAERVGYEA